MKTIYCIVCVSLFIFLFTSCKSSENEVENVPEEECPVTLSLLLKEEVLPFTRSIPSLTIPEPTAVTKGETDPKTLKELCSCIEYIVYKNEESTPCREITFTTEDLDFGTISDKLPRGEYKFILIAHGSTSTERSGYQLSFDKITDTFYYAFDLSIQPGRKNSKSVTLFRVVSKIEFVSTDIVPDNADIFRIKLDKYPCVLNLLSGDGIIPEDEPAPFTFPLAEKIGETELTHGFFTFVPFVTTSLSADLLATDTGSEVLRQRTVNDIQPVANKIIRYKGQLYTPAHSEDEFVISIDEDGEWGGTEENELGD